MTRGWIQGYQMLNVNARGLGDVEAYLTKVRLKDTGHQLLETVAPL